MEREPQSVRAGVEPTTASTLNVSDWQALLPKMNFYRFCQLVERGMAQRPPLGSTASPADDAVRFRPDTGMGFPVSELRGCEPQANHPEGPPTVRTRFLGMYGVDSPLPTHYLDDIAQGREGSDAVSDFLDIFNHRMMTQYYRIWRKYAYPASFLPGGVDDTSQNLLGLIGLGIPGSSQRIATPLSRFLALLGTMRLPTRTAEGVISLVRLLAPRTHAAVTPHYAKRCPMPRRLGFRPEARVNLSHRPVLGRVATEVNSTLHLTLYTEHPQEAREWLPGARLHTDLLVLLRVYLGYRYGARITLTLPRNLLPKPCLHTRQCGVQLGRTAILGLKNSVKPPHNAVDEDNSPVVRISLGETESMTLCSEIQETQDGGYRF